MSRHLTPKEITLTQQDLAFKQAVVSDVEARIKEILPTLVTALIKDELSDWIDATVEAVNEQDAAIARLTHAVFPDTIGATDANPTDPDV